MERVHPLACTAWPATDSLAGGPWYHVVGPSATMRQAVPDTVGAVRLRLCAAAAGVPLQAKRRDRPPAELRYQAKP